MKYFRDGPFSADQDDSGERVGWWICEGRLFVPTADLPRLRRLVAKLEAYEAKAKRPRRRRP